MGFNSGFKWLTLVVQEHIYYNICRKCSTWHWNGEDIQSSTIRLL